MADVLSVPGPTRMVRPRSGSTAPSLRQSWRREPNLGSHTRSIVPWPLSPLRSLRSSTIATLKNEPNWTNRHLERDRANIARPAFNGYPWATSVKFILANGRRSCSALTLSERVYRHWRK
jgi:hypothetical protein